MTLSDQATYYLMQRPVKPPSTSDTKHRNKMQRCDVRHAEIDIDAYFLLFLSPSRCAIHMMYLRCRIGNPSILLMFLLYSAGSSSDMFENVEGVAGSTWQIGEWSMTVPLSQVPNPTCQPRAATKIPSRTRRCMFQIMLGFTFRSDVERHHHDPVIDLEHGIRTLPTSSSHTPFISLVLNVAYMHPFLPREWSKDPRVVILEPRRKRGA